MMIVKNQTLVLIAALLLVGCQSTTTPKPEPVKRTPAATQTPATPTKSTSEPVHEVVEIQQPQPQSQPSLPTEASTPTNWQAVASNSISPDNSQSTAQSQTNPVGYTIVRYKRGLQYIDKVNLTSDILFDYDKADLRADGKRTIDYVVKEFLATVSDQYITLVGHTDSDGSHGYNLALSLDRAISVVRALNGHILDPSKIIVIPAGEQMPLKANTTDVNKAQNRRVEIYVSPWRELSQEFIREWRCPDEKCIVSGIPMLKVTRDFDVQTTLRDLQNAPLITPGEFAYKERAVKVKNNIRELTTRTSVREEIKTPIRIREFKVPVTTRKIRILGPKYHIQPSAKDLKKLKSIIIE